MEGAEHRIAEYNAKFSPPIDFKIDYDENHVWGFNDYFGASLTALVKLFHAQDYFLACCNATGSNTFFVKNHHRPNFSDIPADIESLFSQPQYFLSGLDACGPPTTQTIEFLMGNANK